MHTYDQASGIWTCPDGRHCSGYAGHGGGRNNPAWEAVKAAGPIPRGTWEISAPRDSDTTGPYTMNLTPIDNEQALGRSLFRIHGDNAAHDASHGCVILARADRQHIWESGDHLVKVT